MNSPSSDPDEEQRLREENEILKLKIQAQFGGIHESSDQLSPDIENEFLKGVLAWEEKYNTANAKKIKVADLLGNPVFKPADQISDEEIEIEWKRLETLTEEKAVAVIFLRDRDPRTKYKFVTEELFNHQINEAPASPGLIWHFTYEQFHPDHEMEIHERTMDFLGAWFERDAERMKQGIVACYIQPSGSVLSGVEIIGKIQKVFESFQSFEECKYRIFEIKYELHASTDGRQQALGHSEGMVKYDAVLENGERKVFEGPFKLYMSRDFDWWSIVYFVMEGFTES